MHYMDRQLQALQQRQDGVAGVAIMNNSSSSSSIPTVSGAGSEDMPFGGYCLREDSLNMLGIAAGSSALVAKAKQYYEVLKQRGEVFLQPVLGHPPQLIRGAGVGVAGRVGHGSARGNGRGRGGDNRGRGEGSANRGGSNIGGGRSTGIGSGNAGRAMGRTRRGGSSTGGGRGVRSGGRGRGRGRRHRQGSQTGVQGAIGDAAAFRAAFGDVIGMP